MLLLLGLTLLLVPSLVDAKETSPVSPAQVYIDSSSRPLRTNSTVLPIHFFIPQNYISYADSDVIVSQFINDSMPLPVTGFIEYIFYNSNVLDFFDAQNGSLTARPIWTVNKTQTTKGIVQILVTSSPSTQLQNPGEVLKLFFHVHAAAKAFDESDFQDSVTTILGSALAWQISSDTGKLIVVDNCVPILGSGIKPLTDEVRYDNPLSTAGNISFFISNSAEGEVRLSLYNSAGELVCSKEDIDPVQGWHSTALEITAVSNGFYSLEFDHGRTRKFVHLLILR